MPYELPRPVADLNVAEIAEAEASALAAFDAFSENDDLTDDSITEMERIAGLVVELRAERDRKVTAAADRVKRAKAARESLAVAAADTVVVVEPEAVEESVVVEAAVEEEPQKPKATKVAAVAAHSTRPLPAARERKSRVLLSAAADVPGFAMGSDLEDLNLVAQAMVNRMRGFPSIPNDGAQQQFGVAVLRKEFPEDLIADGRDDYEVVTRASKEARLPGGSLVAAGGWCAPSETIYDLCVTETTDGLVSIPEIQVRRGGIRYTTGPDFSSIYSATGFCQTEAQAIAGTTKPCYEVTCPTFSETRLDVCGLCIKAPILTNAAYPELVQRVISGALIAHQHKMSAKVIGSISTALGAAVATDVLGSAASAALGTLDIIGQQLRSKYRLGLSQSLEVIAPHWLKSIIRQDLANRGGVDMLNVSDQQLNSYFAARGLNVQWVYNYQPLAGTCTTTYPATAELLIYPAGAFVKGVSDVISLNAVYDAASLATNVYTALFVEEGVLVAQTCFSGCKVSIKTCADGSVGTADIACAAP